METKKINRRNFLKVTGAAGAVLAVSYHIPSLGLNSEVISVNKAEALGISLNDFIFIDNAGLITLVNHRPEMGQGVYQSMPMLLAEELEVDISQVRIIQAVGDAKKYGHQLVGGSSSVRTSWEPSRKMGAAVREMLLKAASNKWGVNVADCYAENGTITHRPSGKKYVYGELVADASQLTPPTDPPLKEKKDFKILGQPLDRKDLPLKTDGTAVFGLDMEVPGMMYASIERSPVFKGKVVDFDASEALQVPGVKKVIKTKMPVFSHTREGVAVIADNYFAALQGRKKLKIDWDESGLELLDNETIFNKFRAESKKEGKEVHKVGDFSGAYSKSAKQLEAIYECPFQAHSAMEPMNIIVSVTDDKCEMWGPVQAPNWVRGSLAGFLKIPQENVTVNVSFLGGGFGRRAFTDYPLEAASISKEIGAPVKVVWTREDDTTQGPFRPASVNAFKAGFDEKGNVTAVEKKGVYQVLSHQFPGADKNKLEPLEGANKAYEFANSVEKVVPQELNIPVMWWRSVYASTNGFAFECFVDEMASEVNKDPIDFRMDMLKEEPRYTAILKLLKEKSEWKKNKGNGYGIAIVESFGSICGEVVEVSRKEGELHIKKVTTAIDCGMYVNPDTIKAQIEGSVVMGLTAAIKSEITFDKGRAVEKNFDKFKMLRIHETPEMEIHIMENEEKPGGVGEPGLPPLAPALVNAIFDESGKRIRKLPFNLNEV